MNRLMMVMFGAAYLAISGSAASASVSGIVFDTQGGPVAGAMVRYISDTSPELSSQATTDSQGQYIIPLLPTSIEEAGPSPFSLGQNYPNPFNPTTTIPFSLDRAGYVNLTIYSISGQMLRTLFDGRADTGMHSVTWDGLDESGRHAAAGIYFYRLVTSEHSESLKMLMVDGGSGYSGGVSGNAHRPVPAKPAEDMTFSIFITGDDILTYEEPGRIIIDGHTYDYIVSRNVTDPYELQFVAVPGGTYLMGGVIKIATPVHQVTVSGFDMSKYETTNAQYVQYLNEALDAGEIIVDGPNVTGAMGDWSGQIYYHLDGFTTFRYAEIKIGFADGVFSVKPGFENWPVTWVTWYGAKSFAIHNGYDLPTEAEWEYACRGGEAYEYGTEDGTLSLDKANYMEGNDGNNHPVAVGSYPPNPFGLYDMSGNAWEMCNDWLGSYSAEPQVDPAGPAGPSDYRLVRGGVWYWDDIFCKAEHREACPPEGNGHGLSFRVVSRQQ